MIIKIHSEFTHNCTDDPWDGWADKFLGGGSYHFEVGMEYDVPEEAAAYFIEAGWAAAPGEDVVKPDPTKPVFVQPDSSTLGQQAGEG